VLYVFEQLDVAVTLWEPARWREIFERSSRGVNDIEAEHGTDHDRIRYNIRCLAQAGATKKTVVAERNGFVDLFVPIRDKSRAYAALVTGPFAASRPTRERVLEHWRALTGREGDMSDPEFVDFVTSVLSTVVFEGNFAAEFKKLVEMIALLMVGPPDPDELGREIESLGRRLLEARLSERMWSLARELVDPRTSRGWGSRTRVPRLQHLGIKRFPERVLVGLTVMRVAATDPLDEALRRDGFQRAMVELARKGGHCAGKLGDHGITLMIASRGSPERTQRRLLELGEQAAAIARRRFGLELHVGISARGPGLPEQYQSALNAAEVALSRRTPVFEADDTEQAAKSSLAVLRQELGALVETNPAALAVHFDRYMETVAVRSQYRLDLARAYLESGFERVADAVRDGAILGPKSLSTLTATLERGAANSNGMNDLFQVYRQTISDIVGAIAHPKEVGKDRSLRRAEEFIRKHYTRPLSLARVAREAGFSRTYFSELFRAKMGTTFESFLAQLRILRARQLLSRTPLTVGRVAQLSGFKTPEYLSRAFKRATGETPIEHRRRVRGEAYISDEPTLAENRARNDEN
jgi:AraC-like DNA-binding protein